jgi:L-ascorbate metabolism protein UlaG (beta-lactamase superfamily)
MSLLKGTRVTWLGHATVLVQLPSGPNLTGLNILIDPFIEHNPKYPKGFALPEKIDYILLTHAHMDHTADTVPVAQKHGATVVAIFELAVYMAGKGVASTIGMNIGGTVQLPGVAVTMVEAKHSSSMLEGDVFLYLGDAAGLVLTIADGPVLYHAGDTAVFRDMELIHELYAPEVAMLPVGGHFTMGPKEAALAVRYLEPKAILPLHWGTFPPLTGTPQELAKLVNDPQMVALLAPGEELQA